MTKATNENSKDWLTLLPHLIHDFRTPLLTISLNASTIDDWFPDLVKGYLLAVEHNLMERTIRKQYLQQKEKLGSDIQEITRKLSAYLKVLDQGVKALNIEQADIESRPIQSYLDEAFEQYPFETAEDRQSIDVKIHANFDVQCSSVFVKPLLFHLINMVYEKRDPNGADEITLWTETVDNQNKLHIKTTSAELFQNNVNFAFNRFSDKQGDQYVPGLAFCQLALKQINGDIVSTVIEGEYVEITVLFPE